LPEPDYPTRRDAALAHLAAGDAEEAFHEHRWALWYPARLDDAEFADALGVLSRILVAMQHVELAEACARGSVAPRDPDALYELGYRLIEDGLPAIAATVLARALEVAPGVERLVTELVAALERLLRYADARDLLAAHPALRASSFLCRYLYAYDAAMSGELTLTRAVAPSLVASNETEAFMAARIEAILARADRIAGRAALDDWDLRGWHHVLTGGILLHRSAHGFEEAMRGRFAWLQDDHARIRAGLERLRAVLAAWGIAPPCVYAPPGRDHAIVGAAAARLLELPLAPWPEVGVPAPGLVVAYDLARVEWRDLSRLVERPAGQLLYAHGSHWTEDGPVTPDVTMLLHQELTPPWGARLVVDGGAVTQAASDERDAAVLADEVVAAAPLDEAELAHDDLPGLDALVAAAGPPAPGRRERLWAGSPVPSNRFV
jgi:hypothetical protein